MEKQQKCEIFKQQSTTYLMTINCFAAFIKNYHLEVLNNLIPSYTRKETEVTSFPISPKNIPTNSCCFCHFENIRKNKALDEVFSNTKDLKVPDHFPIKFQYVCLQQSNNKSLIHKDR